jgi:hypothetical protein
MEEELMKVNGNYVLKKVADSYIVVALGGDIVDLNTIISLNDTGAFIWKQLENETDKEAVVSALLAEYDVTKEQAEKDVDAFIQKMTEAGLLA